MSFATWLLGKKRAATAPVSTIGPPVEVPPSVTFSASRSAANPASHSTETTTFRVPIGHFRFIALDVETANSNPSSICQIGLACVGPGGNIEVASTLIDPEQPFSNFNVNLHGIGPEMTRGAPNFVAIMPKIAPLLEKALIIQHSSFDRGAINAACRAHGLQEPVWQWADSVQIARRAWPEFRGNGGHGLGHLKKALALQFEHHDAGQDAMAAAMIVLRAEAHTGMSFADLIDTNCKAPIHFKRSKVAQQVPDSEALLSTLANLELLIAFLNETRPISQGEVEILRNDYIGQVVSQMLQDEDSFGQASLAPSFLSLPENECKLHMRSIDNDLDAQIKIVETACRTFFVTGITPAPYYALRISIILSKSKLANQESAFLANWCRHFGQVPGGTFEALVNRARKRRNPV